MEYICSDFNPKEKEKIMNEKGFYFMYTNVIFWVGKAEGEVIVEPTDRAGELFLNSGKYGDPDKNYESVLKLGKSILRKKSGFILDFELSKHKQWNGTYNEM